MLPTENGIKIKVAPNPAKDRFAITIQTDSKEQIALKIIDVSGRVIETRRGMAANATIYLGNEYKSGTYYLEVIQGSSKRSVQLVKLKD